MNGLSLCSGVAGLELGLKLAIPGYKTVGYVERDSSAAATIVARMEDEMLDEAPVWDSIESFSLKGLRGPVAIISAGYPCQPFSVAGSREGEQDERYLWPEIDRIIGEVGPRYVFLENVAGHLVLGFDRVVGSLSERGYRVGWTTLAAEDLGAPHRRERLFCLAILGDSSFRRLENEWLPQHGELESAQGSEPGRLDREVAITGRAGDQRRRESGEVAVTSGQVEGEGDQRERCRDAVGDRCEGLADTTHSDGGSGIGRPEEGVGKSGERRWRPSGCFPPTPSEDWSSIPEEFWPSIEPGVRGMADGPTSRMDRLRACGNGVVPVVAAAAFLRLEKVLRSVK